MTQDLKLIELTGSPNSVKIRIALGYKGLDYEREALEFTDFPGDRSTLVAVSRQPRAPVLQHGKTVIFDSGAILRYLDANFPDSPSIFSADYETFGEIERWEMFAHTKIGAVTSALFGQIFAPEKDPRVLAKADKDLAEVTGVFEDRLSGRDFLVGDTLTAADIICAAPLYLADLTDENAGTHPIAGFFQASMKLGEKREKTREWLRRIMAFDPIKGQR